MVLCTTTVNLTMQLRNQQRRVEDGCVNVACVLERSDATPSLVLSDDDRVCACNTHAVDDDSVAAE